MHTEVRDNPSSCASASPTELIFLAPSWSWAAHNFSARYKLVKERILYAYCWGSFHEETLVSNVINAAVTLVSSDKMGQVSDGFVEISGYLRPNLETEACKACFDGSPDAYAYFEAYDSGYDEHNYHSRKDTFFLVLTHVPNIDETERYSAQSRMVKGLILEQTGRVPDEYRRVGSFALNPDVRAEFADLDIDNPDHQIITIV